MNSFYQNIQQVNPLSTPYRQVTSEYVHDKKPYQIHQNYRVFPDTFNINQGNTNYQYKPKIIMSGYIVGEPVAFTQLPNLPKQYPQFSPSKQNIHKPLIIQPNTLSGYQPTINFQIGSSINKNQTSDFILQSRSRIQSTNKKIQIGSIPLKYSNQINTISKSEYDNLMSQNQQLRERNYKLEEQNKNLIQKSNLLMTKQNKIRELQYQIFGLHKNIQTLKKNKTQFQSHKSNPFLSSDSMSDKNRFHINQLKDSRNNLSKQKIDQIELIFGQYLQKYRNSILEQQKLLIDRFRLQCKNEQIQFKKYQLQQSRRKQRQMGKQRQRQSHRKISLHQRNQNQYFTKQKFMKESFSIPLKSQQRQKHYHTKRLN